MSINDISFYVFTLPMIDIAISFSQFVLLVAIVGALIGHFIYGGVAWGQESGLEVTRSARRHLGILAAIYVLLLGAGHWFRRYDLLTGQHPRFDGASYTDVNAILPAQDRKSTRLNSSYVAISYAVFCLKKKKRTQSLV